MKFLTLAVSTLLATSVTARSSLFSSSAVGQLDDSLTVPGKNPLEHCQDPKDDILELKHVDLDPNPPKPGQKLNITAKGILKKDVGEGAKINIQVKYGLITIIRKTFDLCDNVQNVDLECPLKKDNDTALTKEVDLPREIPPGKYTVVADVLTKDDEKITCLTATVQFSIGGSTTQQVIADFSEDL